MVATLAPCRLMKPYHRHMFALCVFRTTIVRYADTLVVLQRASSSLAPSAASSSRRRQSRASTSTTPSTTSCARFGSITKTCPDTQMAATGHREDHTTRWRWMATTPMPDVAVSARSCERASSAQAWAREATTARSIWYGGTGCGWTWYGRSE